MNRIRRAEEKDLSRIAEIYVFNDRLFYYPLFQDPEYSFQYLQVIPAAEMFRNVLDELYVYDDSFVKGFLRIHDTEIEKLYVDPFFQNRRIGAALIEYAKDHFDARFLWALEKNTRAIAFYKRHGFIPDGERKPEPDTAEFQIRLVRSDRNL